jgi:hypothetical protein
VVAGFVPLIFIVDDFIEGPTWAGRPSWELLSRSMNIWVRVLGSLVACLLLLAVAARASSSICNERDRQTFDALLTTPLDSNTILFAKWIGNILSVRWAWLWLGTIYALGLVSGGLHPLALPLLLGAWIVYAFVVSGIGLWFSMVSRTTLRATLWTLLCTTGAGVGHWVVWMCCFPLRIALHREPTVVEWFGKFQVGFTPPVALGWAFPFCSLNFRENRQTVEAILFGVLGVVCWIVLGAFLALVTSTRFRAVTGRTPLPRPQAAHAQRGLAHAAPREPTEPIAKSEGIVGLDGEANQRAETVAVEQESSEATGAKPIEEAPPEQDPQLPGY